MPALQLRHVLLIGLVSSVAAYYFPPLTSNQGFYSLFTTLLNQQQQQQQQQQQLLQQQLIQQQQQQSLLQQQQQQQLAEQPQWQAPVLGSRNYFDKRGDVVFLLQGKATSGYLPPEEFNTALQVPASYVLGHKIVQRYPHDAGAFTQGLFVHNGTMYESTGLHGQSTLRKVDIKSGEVLLMTRFSDDIFGEGITMHSDNKIYGLSWQERKGFRIDPESLNIEMIFEFPPAIREGWGISSNGKELMVTDSTNNLHFVDSSFRLLRSLPLRDPLQNKDLAYANELEFIDGKLYANVYGLDHIAVIDIATGLVTQWIDCRGLWKGGFRGNNAVFNGIAYNTDAKTLYVTGKNWDSLFEIELVKAN